MEKSWRHQAKLRQNLVSVISIKWNFCELNKTNWLTCLTGHKYVCHICVIPQVLFSFFFFKMYLKLLLSGPKAIVLSFFWTWQLPLLLLICLCSPNWSWIDCVDQTSLEIKVLLHQHQQGWDYRCEPTCNSISFTMRKKHLTGWCAVGCGLIS